MGNFKCLSELYILDPVIPNYRIESFLKCMIRNWLKNDRISTLPEGLAICTNNNHNNPLPKVHADSDPYLQLGNFAHLAIALTL